MRDNRHTDETAWPKWIDIATWSGNVDGIDKNNVRIEEHE